MTLLPNIRDFVTPQYTISLYVDDLYGELPDQNICPSCGAQLPRTEDD